MTITAEARRLAKLKAASSKAAERADKAKQAFEDAQRKFYDHMQDEGIGSIKVDGTNFVPAQTVYGQVQDREAFIAWAQENEEELLEPHERKALINELVREAVDNGTELPPGLGFYTKEYVSQRVA
jgi:hypothetical protein